MTLNPQLVGELTRQRMGDPDGSRSARYINLIPQALKAFARKVAADPSLRPWLTTDRVNTTIAISSGKVNLATVYSTYFVMEEYMDLGDLYLLIGSELINITPASDTFTIRNFSDEFADLDRVQISSTGSNPGGISPNTDYYLRDYDPLLGIGKLSPNADGTGTVDITSVGSGDITITKMDVGSEQRKIELLKNPVMASYPRRFADDFTYGYVQGNALFILPAGTLGRVAFACPFWPQTLSALPDDAAAEQLFLDKIYELATGPGSDAAQDMQQ